MKGTTTLELPRGAGSAGIARLIVTAHGSALSSEQLKSANLMVSELVSNACRHGAGRIELTRRVRRRRRPRRPCTTRASGDDRDPGAAPGARRLGPDVRRPARGRLGRRRRRLARLVPVALARSCVRAAPRSTSSAAAVGHLDQREAVGDLDRADVAAAEPRLAGDRADQVLRADAGARGRRR